MRQRSIERLVADLLLAMPNTVTNLLTAGGVGVSHTTLTALLPRMIDQGLVVSSDPQPRNGHGSRTKKVYSPGPLGEKYLKAYQHLLILLGDALA